MNRIPFFVIGLSLLTIFTTGCYYDKADVVYPAPVCDTTGEVTLSADINNILAANCYTCHGGTADNGGGIPLDQYDVLKAYADNGLLMSAITHDGSTENMPKDAPKLSDCDIAKFRIWIDAGALDN